MKNLTPFLALLLVFSLAVSTACNKDDNPGTPQNALIIGGSSYDLSSGYIKDFGSTGNSSFSWQVILTSSGVNAANGGFTGGTGNAITLDLNSNDENGLVVGTYDFSDDQEPFTLGGGLIYENYNFDNFSGTFSFITGGSLTIDFVGDDVRIDWDLTTVDGKGIDGNFQGMLEDI